MPSVRAGIATLLVLLLLTVSGEAQDVIRMKTGGELKGRIVEETETTVTIELLGGNIEVPRVRIKEIVRGEAPAPAAGTEKSALEAEASYLLYGPGSKLRGWHETRTYRRDDSRLYETVTVFLETTEAPRVSIHVVEEVGPDLVSRRFTYREKVGDAKETLRSGRIEGAMLHLTEVRRGEASRRSVPFPPGTLFPSAARARVLERREELSGGLETPVFDPRSDSAPFQLIRWTVGERETVERNGRRIEVLVLRVTRDGVTSEERIGTDGRTVSLELNGPSVVAKAVDAETVKRVRDGKAPGEAGAAGPRNTHVDHEAGFSIRKPGADWSFVPGEGKRKVTLRQEGGTFAYVDVIRDASLLRGTQLETFALNLQRLLAAASKDFVKESDGYGTMAGERAYRLVARSRSKDEEIRSLVVAVIHEDVAWILAASCPVKYFDRARPSFERVVVGFTFLK